MQRFRNIFRLVNITALSIATSAHAKNWDITPADDINWKEITNGDTICLSGVRNDSISVKKNITIDGNCYSNEPAILNGSISPKWTKDDNYWKTMESFPLDGGRYTSWILKNGLLTLLDNANISRNGDYFSSGSYPDLIEIPKYYAAIRVNNTSEVVIKNLIIKNYVTHGIVVSNSSNTIVDNISVSYVGGGINPKGHKRAGAGITFDGNTKNVTVMNSHVYQCYDTGISIQLFKDFSEQAENIRFINNTVDRCGAGVSVAVHKPSGSTIKDVEIVGKFTNLGYGWSGIYDNNVHGRGVMVKQFEGSAITNIRLHDSLIDTYSWVGVLQYSGELDAWNNVIKNGTGEYKLSKNILPSAYAASGGDYSAGPSDDEAVGSFHDNQIENINGYAFEVVHNTPRESTRMLTIKNNKIKNNKEYFRNYLSSGVILD